MSLKYSYNEDVVKIIESTNESDFEFDIKLSEEEHRAGIKKLQRSFEDNKVYTDVLFYPYDQHHYRIIVRQDYYVDFILALMKHHLIERVEWS
ncbi:hypothetical protein [Paenibacillus mendelii]|uniref:Uncharacterized protein n=1 Tax=Paenibacillus mendelii TaxID=206163 RepID=A0ABV6JE64_9BACL|nr:hypothetical protein [Paenibacillus mendelii]MCQ6557080.1 hypothetical protein [Paenibacillus mendelii]